MRWNELDSRLRELYNCVAEAHGEQMSAAGATKADGRAYELMDELTVELKGMESKNGN